MADVEAVRILEYRLQAGQPQNPGFSLVIFVHRTEWKCSSLGTLVDWLASEELWQEFKKMDCNRKNPKPLPAIGQICAQQRMECSQLGPLDDCLAIE